MSLKLLALSLAPSLAIAVFIFWKDRYDKEPMRLLVWAFVLGILSIFPAIILEGYVLKNTPYLLSDNQHIQTAILAFIVVGFSEELSKFIMVKRFLYPSHDFNEPYDGITYSVMVSLGFASIENLLYVWEGGVQTAIARMFTAVPAHASFAVIMGYYLGLAKFKGKNNFLLAASLLAPAFFHGAYDYFLFQNIHPFFNLGALVSLVVVIILSFKAISLHQKNSPFGNN